MEPNIQKKPTKVQIDNLIQLNQSQDYENLERHCRILLDNYPNHPETENFLGTSLAGQSLYEESLNIFFKALIDAKRHVTKAKILNNIGVSYIKLGDHENAIHYLKQAILEDSESVSAYFNLANSLRSIGDVQGSLKVYEDALKLDPNHLNSIAYYSIALKTLGNFQESISLCYEALKLRPDWGMVHRHLSSMIKYSENDTHFEEMMKIIEKNSLSKEDSMHLYFAISKAYEDKKMYKDAFKFLSKANDLYREDITFSTKNSNNYFRLVKKVFSKDFCEEAFDKENHLGEGIIFVLGMPRSGTSLAEQILASHSKVFGAGELRHFRKSIDRVFLEKEGKKFPKNVALYPLDSFKEIGTDYEKTILELRNGSTYFVDKMPYNFMYIPLIRLSLPKSKIVLTERNPIDNCLSIYKMKFGIGNAYAYNQEELAQYYNSYKDIVGCWKRIFPNDIFSLNYEELTKSQKKITENLLEFCGLDWEEACLEFHKTDRNNKTASSFQVRQPLYSSSVKLWENYKDELNSLINSLEI